MINIVSIVGASGFIGREVVDYFIENKIIVKILIDSQSKLLNFNKSDYIICYEKSPLEEDIPIAFFESDALINCFGSINGISSINNGISEGVIFVPISFEFLTFISHIGSLMHEVFFLKLIDISAPILFNTSTNPKRYGFADKFLILIDDPSLRIADPIINDAEEMSPGPDKSKVLILR